MVPIRAVSKCNQGRRSKIKSGKANLKAFRKLYFFITGN